MKEVTGDVTHSLLHLDSRVWRTLQLLVRRPGELTREFIAGRHQTYIPPFRLYLAVSIIYFALSVLLPESGSFDLDAPAAGQGVVAPAELKDVTGELRKELAAEGVSQEDIDKALEQRQELQGQHLRRHAQFHRLRAGAQPRLREHQARRRPALHRALRGDGAEAHVPVPAAHGGSRDALLLAPAAAVRRAPRPVPAQPRLHVPAARRSPRS